MKGKVQTVCGWVNPSELGRVLPHEHLMVDISPAFHKNPLVNSGLFNCPFTLKNLGWIRQYPYSHIPNMLVESPDADKPLLEDLKAFKAAGGGTVVENTTTGMKRDVKFMKRASKETGLHIIAGTAYYVEPSIQDKETLKLTVEQMVEEMTRDLTQGCPEDPSIKCGILGEVGSIWPITEFEKRALQAAGEVESSVGCPVMIHPHRVPAAAPETLRIYSEAGGNPKKAVMAHLDRTFYDFGTLDEFASSSECFLEYDLFGIETSYYQVPENVDMVSDAQRIQFVKHLIDGGFLDRILISQDICTKHRMEAFGGHGFAHLLSNVRPHMVSRGISLDQIDVMMVDNAARWLTFSK